jgi:hypothetical protein
VSTSEMLECIVSGYCNCNLDEKLMEMGHVELHVEGSDYDGQSCRASRSGTPHGRVPVPFSRALESQFLSFFNWQYQKFLMNLSLQNLENGSVQMSLQPILHASLHGPFHIPIFYESLRRSSAKLGLMDQSLSVTYGTTMGKTGCHCGQSKHGRSG